MALQVEHHQTSRFGEWLVVLDDGQLLFRQGKMRLLAPPPAAPPTAPGQDDQSGDRDGCVYWVLSKHCSNQGALGKSGLTSKSLTGIPAVRQNPALCQTPSSLPDSVTAKTRVLCAADSQPPRRELQPETKRYPAWARAPVFTFEAKQPNRS